MQRRQGSSRQRLDRDGGLIRGRPCGEARLAAAGSERDRAKEEGGEDARRANERGAHARDADVDVDADEDVKVDGWAQRWGRPQREGLAVKHSRQAKPFQVPRRAWTAWMPCRRLVKYRHARAPVDFHAGIEPWKPPLPINPPGARCTLYRTRGLAVSLHHSRRAEAGAF